MEFCALMTLVQVFWDWLYCFFTKLIADLALGTVADMVPSGRVVANSPRSSVARMEEKVDLPVVTDFT
jgi:hypothetical protein